MSDAHACWLCSPLGTTTSAGDSPLSLHLSETEPSRFLQLVLHYLRPFDGVPVTIERLSGQDQPVLNRSTEAVTDPITIARSLASAAGAAASGTLFGAAGEAEAEVDRFLTSSHVETQSAVQSEGQSAVPNRIQTLNIHLATRSVLVGSRAVITVADLATFSFLHGQVVNMTEEDRATVPNFMRWFDFVQWRGDTDSVYDKLPVPKPKFSPPAPLPPTPKAPAPAASEKAASATSAPASQSSKINENPEADRHKPQNPEPNSAPPPASAGGAAEPGDERAVGNGSASGVLPPGAAGEGGGVGGKEKKKEKEKMEKEKKEKKEKPPAQKKEVDTGISVVDIRVGEVKKVWKHPSADTLYVEEIDLGEGSVRQVVSGLAKFLTEEQFLGRKVLVIANVKPSKMRDVVSSGLVLCASNEEHTVVDPVAPPARAVVGERVTFEGHDGPAEEQLNPKKKQLEKIFPDFKTNADCVPQYQGVAFMTSAGPCTSSLPHAIVK